ncbi:hypothetical protein QBC34DRAFT_377478 [Podospora aff. communis PSN243]|uniref:Uncharacterized protein n=1 Tax=Podospora aff. communis PSN243 TaxID=3040156 RepID=A0AAV9GXP4_9PEZI|nr:hypothetical protein QBC34DRAFT_377478 [Podospora aff. communis PSN243]
MCHLTTLRHRCGCNTLLRLSCPHHNRALCSPPHRHTLLTAQTLIHPCLACHASKWDALDECRLSEFDDHQAHMSRTLSRFPPLPLESRRLLYRDLHLEDTRAEAMATAARQDGERKIQYTARWFRWYSTAALQLCFPDSGEGWANAKVWANFRWLQLHAPSSVVVRLDREVAETVRRAACLHAKAGMYGAFTAQEKSLLRGARDRGEAKRLVKGFLLVRRGERTRRSADVSLCGSCGQATPVPELVLGGGDGEMERRPLESEGSLTIGPPHPNLLAGDEWVKGKGGRLMESDGWAKTAAER